MPLYILPMGKLDYFPKVLLKNAEYEWVEGFSGRGLQVKEYKAADSGTVMPSARSLLYYTAQLGGKTFAEGAGRGG